MEAAIIRGQIFIPERSKSPKRKLDPGNKTLAALDFYHTSQQSSESVSNFITGLGRVFQRGLGRENLSIEAREM